MITLKLNTTVAVARDNELTDLLSRSAVEISGALADAQVSETLQLAPGATRQVAMPSVGTPLLLYVRAGGPLDVRTAAADSDPQRIAPLVAADPTRPGILLKTGEIAGLWLTNPDDSTPVDAAVLILTREGA